MCTFRHVFYSITPTCYITRIKEQPPYVFTKWSHVCFLHTCNLTWQSPFRCWFPWFSLGLLHQIKAVVVSMQNNTLAFLGGHAHFSMQFIVEAGHGSFSSHWLLTWVWWQHNPDTTSSWSCDAPRPDIIRACATYNTQCISEQVTLLYCMTLPHSTVWPYHTWEVHFLNAQKVTKNGSFTETEKLWLWFLLERLKMA